MIDKDLENKRIRPMKLEDLDRVLEIERGSFRFPWTRKMWQDELTLNDRIRCFVLEEYGKIIAYYSAWHIAGESLLNNIAVDNEYRLRGLAGMMLEHFFDEASLTNSEACYLEVAERNSKAIALYQKYGFKKISTRKDYYSMEHEDAHIMKKKMGRGHDSFSH